ncbi:hypothetical protein BGX21_003342 [Mortierella sp. AD011]|nr:hypothetical protein BGX20_003662 [Mortierella sp. AD010]KAF9400862.1 hypothetical protein BGX21_003342 [Mortierella sp. AD011]
MTFVPPELDLNPPTGWSKPASALGLLNPLDHSLPQSQQVQRLQQQIEHHRQLQRNTLQQQNRNRNNNTKRMSSPFSSGGDGETSNNNTGELKSERDMFNSTNQIGRFSTSDFNQNRHNSQQRHPHNFSGGDVQHISIKNHDDNGDSEMSDGEDGEDGDISGNNSGRRSSVSSRGSSVGSDSRGMYINMNSPSNRHFFHHHRSTSNPHMSHGFGGLQGFTPLSPGSSLTPSSPRSFTSDSNSFGAASAFTPPNGGFFSHQNQSGGFQYGSQQSGNCSSDSVGAVGVESSLASLAALSVMSMSGSDPTRRQSSGSSESSSGSQSLSFQPQNSHPSTFQNQALTNNNLMSGNQNNSGNGSSNVYTSALGQQLQLQRQQHQQQQEQPQEQRQEQQLRQGASSYQQDSTPPVISTSLPSFPTSQYQPHHQHQHQQSQSATHGNDRSQVHTSTSNSKSLVLPRRSLPLRPPETSAPRKYHGRNIRKPVVPVENIVKEVVTPTRRMAHIISEQKRREKINDGFEELKSVIPE